MTPPASNSTPFPIPDIKSELSQKRNSALYVRWALFSLAICTAMSCSSIDASGAVLYWTDSGQDTVSRSSTIDADVKVVARGQGSTGMRGLAVDPVAGFLFWGEDDGLFRSDLNGDNPQLIVPGKGDINSARDVAADPKTGRVFFNSFEKISSASYDGSDVRTIFEGSPRGVSLDLEGRHLYWGTAERFDRVWESNIWRSELDGTNVSHILTTDGLLEATTVSSETSEIFWTADDAIRASGLDGQGVRFVASGIDPEGIVFSSQDERVFWTEANGPSPGAILSVESDGTNKETYLSTLDLPRRLTILERFYGDFDGDLARTLADIDLLNTAIAEMSDLSDFDVNDDGTLDENDRNYWVSNLASSYFGDTNLDRKVDFEDFLSLSTGFGKPGGWADGDFDGSGDVAFTDFLLLSENFGESTVTAATVPESAGSVMPIGIGLISLMLVRSRR